MCTVSVWAAPGVQFEAMIRIQERVDGPAIVMVVWMTRRHGAVLLGGREVVWVTLAPIHQLVTVIDADHLSRCLTLTTSHRALRYSGKRRHSHISSFENQLLLIMNSRKPK